MPTKIYTHQQLNGNRKNLVASARLEPALYESMIRCAELSGYDSVSSYVKDALLSKMSDTATAMLSFCNEAKAKV